MPLLSNPNAYRPPNVQTAPRVKQARNTGILRLPNELLIEIALQIDNPHAFLALSAACRRLYTVVSGKHLQKQYAARWFTTLLNDPLNTGGWQRCIVFIVCFARFQHPDFIHFHPVVARGEIESYKIKACLQKALPWSEGRFKRHRMKLEESRPLEEQRVALPSSWYQYRRNGDPGPFEFWPNGKELRKRMVDFEPTMCDVVLAWWLRSVSEWSRKEYYVNSSSQAKSMEWVKLGDIPEDGFRPYEDCFTDKERQDVRNKRAKIAEERVKFFEEWRRNSVG
ncbi:hypothetical protein BJ508DRAFT_304913 [Ascobolus immersus RN42]|uniref:F-box domain-containing protein n=1 Tax=Ascobolus immersus RN42 TaxID=1160509 RepID=A0A3N4INL9_ASCIM|nr:hypothetical protein BJ508DRAFT_304913 [Ascobolus immersus RN42]